MVLDRRGYYSILGISVNATKDEITRSNTFTFIKNNLLCKAPLSLIFLLKVLGTLGKFFPQYST